jgi:hypothetical protein
MIIESMTIRVNNFDNDAMQNDERGEVVRILKRIIEKIESVGIVDLDSDPLMDSNGNKVGFVTVSVIDEDEMDDDDDDYDNDEW